MAVAELSEFWDGQKEIKLLDATCLPALTTDGFCGSLQTAGPMWILPRG